MTNRPNGPNSDLLGLLSPILAGRGHEESYLIAERQANPRSHTYWSEFVTLRFDSRPDLRIFCKYYDGSSHRDLGHGHRGGLRYEVDVYRSVLSGFDVTLPVFLGASYNDNSGETLLVLDSIDGAVKVTKAPEWKDRMHEAAQWLGRFHRLGGASDERDWAGTLMRYDSDYYRGWPERARVLARPFRSRFPGFEESCAAFGESIDTLLSLAPTLIHGKFYPKEVLVAGGAIYPVDWESAAMAPGVIDLAMFIDGWGPTAEPWIDAYCEARWAREIPNGFESALRAARLYVHMRWLGDFDELTSQQAVNPWRFEEVRKLVGQMG
ncbi:MAG: phosphotransferase [Acidimicrobiia bacterium]|nr:phosphotransferase [Acidimicrobiia bacterium]